MYYLLLGVFYLISFLPFRVLYVLSDILFFLLYYLVRYRRQVVLDNMAIAFPEKSAAEREKLCRRFYRRFIDNWLEAIKLLSMSEATLKKRFVMDFGPLPALYAAGKSCHVHLGHHFNWEWANVAFGLNGQFTLLGVYQPITNKSIDRLFRYFRKKSGTVLLAANNMRQEMLPWRNRQYILGLVADQNPGNTRKAFWLDFFSRKTPFVTGPEKNARLNNIPVIFAKIERVKRGFYTCTMILAEENPANTKEGELTIKFVNFLEERIRKQPETWLWTHRRWKHEWNEEFEKQWLER